MICPAHPALDAPVGSTRRAVAGKYYRQVPSRETNQRILTIEIGDDDLADFPIGNRFAAARAYDFDNHPFVDDQTLAGGSLVGDHADITGSVKLPHFDLVFFELLLQGRREWFATDDSLTQAPHRLAHILGLIKKNAEK